MKSVLPLTTFLFLLLMSCKKEKKAPDRIHELVKEELNIVYGDDPLQKMDVYFPDGYDKNTPVIFLIHGGGFIAGTKDDFTSVAKLFITRGFIAVNLDHRLVNSSGINQHPPLHRASEVKVTDQVNDVALAVEKYKSEANSWGAGTSRMYMAGHSAGGTLAMLYVQDKKNKDIRASGNFAGLTNLTLTEEMYNTPPDHIYWPAVKELIFRMSGAEVVHSNALAIMAISPNWVSSENRPGRPNITVMPKSNDKDLRFEPYYNTVEDAKMYHEELNSYGTSSQYILVDTDHGFGSHPDDWAKAVAYVSDFFWNH